MFQKLSIKEALACPNAAFVDVRTPLEFSEDAIPGAVNIPILSDEERVAIGTVYKQAGAQLAREKGLACVAPKLPAIYQELKCVSEGKDPILYCWRGGLRSMTVAVVMSLMGFKISVLQGGYKSFRREVLRVLNGTYPFKFIILYGLTGAGKTGLLQKLNTYGVPVIDLEGLAHHRGSVFGHVGIERRQTQKRFETFLHQEIQKHSNLPFVFIEGESRLIGNVVLPQSWMNQMANGKKVLVRSSLQKRTERILCAYLPSEVTDAEKGRNLVQIGKALYAIERRLGGALFQEILASFKEGDYVKTVRLLLEHYYDKKYKYTAVAKTEDFDLVIDNDTPEDEISAVEKLMAFSYKS